LETNCEHQPSALGYSPQYLVRRVQRARPCLRELSVRRGNRHLHVTPLIEWDFSSTARVLTTSRLRQFIRTGLSSPRGKPSRIRKLAIGEGISPSSGNAANVQTFTCHFRIGEAIQKLPLASVSPLAEAASYRPSPGFFVLGDALGLKFRHGRWLSQLRGVQ
jgi:hypothetical protein